jgi:hypothetical protein
LLPALSLLEAERTKYLSVDAEYARIRREQKQGVRVPPCCYVTPRDPLRWHGDERAGARHALASWLRRSHDADVAGHRCGRTVLAAIDCALAAKDQPDLELDELQATLDWARRQIHVIGWEADRAEYRVAWNMHRLLGQLHLVGNGATPIATPWNFA